LLDEMATTPEAPPTEKVPPEVATYLNEQRLHVGGVPGNINMPSLLQKGEREGWQMHLPPGALLGQAGISGKRLERHEHRFVDHPQTEPMRPPWVGQSFQPRPASTMVAHGAMQRHNGKTIEPYYGVYGSDDRQVYYPSTYPWRCIGRIFTWTNWAGGGGWSWWGSGVLVGPRHVLTAGHVCPWGSGSWAMKFVPAYWNGSSASGPGAISWTSDFRGWNTNDTVAANDMAVLRLYDPIGSSLGWMGTKVYDSAWEGGQYWTLAGYPSAIAGGERPSYQQGISVLDDDNDGDAKELEHHGDATAGDSGGPFFGFWNGSPYAIGTTSGGEKITGTPFGWGDEDNNIEAGGSALVNLVLWAQANWP